MILIQTLIVLKYHETSKTHRDHRTVSFSEQGELGGEPPQAKSQKEVY